MLENGTTYHDETPRAVVCALERARVNDTRIRLVYGDTDSGLSWGEVNDVAGTLGRSMGPVKIPILLANSRSVGGAGVLDHCIIGIRYSRKVNGRYSWIYRHPKYTGEE